MTKALKTFDKEKKKNFKETLNNIRFLVSVARASALVKKVTVQERDGDFSLRPQIHLILRANTGSIKSTILNYVKDVTDAIEVSSTTTPGMIGTIDKSVYQMIPGAAWNGRNKVLLFDEFKFRKRSDDWLVFLKLLEDQKYSKKFGVYSSSQIERDGDLYLKVDKGGFDLKTRFSAVVATMKKFEVHRGDDFKAFVNRTVPYEFGFSMDEIDYLLEHTKLFAPLEFKIQDEYVVKMKEYLAMKKFVRGLLDDSDASKENFARAVGDVVRFRCIVGKFDRVLSKKLVEWKVECYRKIGAYFKDNLKDSRRGGGTFGRHAE